MKALNVKPCYSVKMIFYRMKLHTFTGDGFGRLFPRLFQTNNRACFFTLTQGLFPKLGGGKTTRLQAEQGLSNGVKREGAVKSGTIRWRVDRGLKDYFYM